MNRFLRSILGVAAIVLVAGSPVAAASCNGNGHEILLSSGIAAPGSGTTGTPVTFSVRYANSDACAPSRVAVVIPGVGTFPMSGSGSAWGSGVTFARAVNLPAGSWAYSFTATSGKKTATLASVAPSRVSITAPKPRPTPPPPATVAPAPQPPPPPPPPPTPAPTPAPTPRPSPKAATPTPAPASPSPSPIASTVAGAWPVPSSRPRLAPVRPRPAPRGVLPGTDSSGFPLAQLVDESLKSYGPVIAYSLTTAGGLALFFVLLRRRGSDGAAQPLMAAAIPNGQGNAVTASAPGSTAPGHPATPTVADGGVAAVRALPPMRELIPPIDYDILRDPDAPAGPAPDEVGVPRWLRPSVRSARFGEVTRRRDWGD
jgi:hypothetical protein